MPGPVWKRQSVQHREIPGKLCSLASKIQQLKQRVAAGETGNVDYYALIGLRRGCSRSELERAHLLLTLKHKPDKSSGFIEKCEFADEKDVDSVRDRARMSALLLYRLIQKGYSNVMATILDEESSEKQRKKAAAALQAAVQAQQSTDQPPVVRVEAIQEVAGGNNNSNRIEKKATVTSPPASVFQGVFCRDLAAVGTLLSQTGYNHPMPIPIPVKYEALSC
ncbi:UNVERIFIED_CONTAM: hypothetical protein Sradi_0480200 [Sesamum radiatum]|uniref:J domain-containing protein n=1 Tax=Sesamum radiatum TaxID=300843 RepID=A0AAW2W8A5_SESRA